MAARYFTVEEANELLPTLRPLMGRLLEKRAKVVRLSQQVEPLLEELYLDVGGPVLTTMTQDFETIDSLIRQLQAYGCVVKDINVGLLDFLADRNGRDVYLCWRYGEPEVAYFHDLHTGYNSREAV